MVVAALAPLTGSADSDEMYETFKNVNSNDEEEVKSIIKDYFIPFFDQHYSDEGMIKIKNTLRFFLSTDTIDWTREYDSCLMAFDPPNNSKLFFIWLWEVMFPNESYQSGPYDDYCIVTDFDDYQTIFQSHRTK